MEKNGIPGGGLGCIKETDNSGNQSRRKEWGKGGGSCAVGGLGAGRKKELRGCD